MAEFPPELANFVDAAGRLKQWPSKQKLQLAALPVFAQAIPAGRHFTAREISELLNQRHTFDDAALLRRLLCDLGYLERTRDGREYWRSVHDALPEAEMNLPALVYHAAGRSGRCVPNSLGGLKDCLEAGARYVEVDISPLADGEYALLHDRFLEDETDGRGSVAATTGETVRTLRRRWRGELTGERVATLGEAVALAAAAPDLAELQLDLKAYSPLADAALESLARLVVPLGRRVRVSCTADRDLHRLHGVASDLALGFDPLRRLDVDPGPGKRTSRYLSRTGDYGYLDDHPLAADRWGTACEYLAARADVLWGQAPVSLWYVRATLLARMLEDGFDWIADLHRRGAQVAAWTLNPDHPHQLGLAAELIEHGVDRITTDDAPRLAAALGRAGEL